MKNLSHFGHLRLAGMNTLFSREEIFAKSEFEIFSREYIFANILFTRKYLPAKISSRENFFSRKYLPAKISSRELFPCRRSNRVTCPPVGCAAATYCFEGIEQ